MILLLLVYRKMDVDRTENKNRVVGLREVLASLKEDKISKIYLAKDSDAAYKERVLTAALEKNVQVEVGGTSAEFAEKWTRAQSRFRGGSAQTLTIYLARVFISDKISQGGNKWQQSIS